MSSMLEAVRVSSSGCCFRKNLKEMLHHLPIGQYTMVNQQNMNRRIGPIRPRSAKPPMARTTVIQANMHWSNDQRFCQVLNFCD